MFGTPQAEHQWLDQLLGEWKFENECRMPDGTTSSNPGTMSCRSLGGLWLIAESSGVSDECGAWNSIMTVGFDPAKNEYVGTFVGSMMANLWEYRGVLDANRQRLPLNSVGPRFEGGGTCKYRDTIEIVDADNWLLISEMEGDDDQWVQFMVGRHTRC